MSDSTLCAKGQTSVFASRRGTFKGSQTLKKNRKLIKIDEQLLWRYNTNERRAKNLILFAGAGPTCRSKVAKTVGPGPTCLAKVPKTAGPGPA